MKHSIFIILLFATSILSAQNQANRPTAMVLRYYKVTEFIFDEKKQNYEVTDTIDYSGAISVDPKKIFIKSYNNKPDKILKIIKVEKEEGTDRDMYHCEVDGEWYAVAITSDKRLLTQIGLNRKYIYELKTSSNKNKQAKIFIPEKNVNPNKIFIAQSLETKPLFGNAKTFEEGEQILKDYISTELIKHHKTKSGTCYISIVINKLGQVEKVKLLYGKDEEFNKVALEIVKILPNWKPGKQKNKPVNASYNIEVKR